MSHTIYRKNDNTVEWTWLTDTTGDFVNDGEVSMILYSGYSLDPATGILAASDGDVNVVVHGPVVMLYVVGSNGKYQGKIPASLNLDLTLAYTIQVDARANGHIARRSIPVTVVDRIN
jgi:hypothetical protein